ncbi:MAG: hypothetical protein V4653_01055 [Pseudomonadota bacterium]
MPVINPRRSLLLLAAAWIGGVRGAAAQAVVPEAPLQGTAQDAPRRRRMDPERRARMQQMRAELNGHVETARAAIARRQAEPATEAIERAETLLLNSASARAGRRAEANAGRQGGGQRGSRARAALATARTALASRDFVGAEAALRPVAARLQAPSRRG